MDRRCPGCGDMLQRRKAETDEAWLRRSHCGTACSNTARNMTPPWESFAHFTLRGANGCINWTGARTAQGYGRSGRRTEGGDRLAHRIAYTMQFGPIPDGLCVLHRCDNPSCVNPHHLFLGTVKDNSDDMMRKGRNGQLKGEAHATAKLTRQIVAVIRKSNESQRSLGRRYGVSKSLVGRIVRGEIWPDDERWPK